MPAATGNSVSESFAQRRDFIIERLEPICRLGLAQRQLA